LLVPVQNAVNTWEQMVPQSPNLFFGQNNDVASSEVDIESVIVHELGHCLGLAHPNLGSPIPFPLSDFTASSPGPDGSLSLNPGADGIIGSADDIRGDDINLHLFDISGNNPFVSQSIIDATTYTIDLNDLPAGDLFAANADRTVGNALGYPDTEAVMQQLTLSDEAQRELAVDDVNTIRYAMSGLDRTQGTADDYNLSVQFQGVSSQNCDVTVEINSNATGFAACDVSLQALVPSLLHWQVVSGRIFLNGNINWYFNQTPNSNSLACNGLAVTVDIAQGQLPTAGNDVILGTPGVDVIDALGGDDVVCGGDGDDVIRGGPGQDQLFGEVGADTLFGGGDDDLLVGGNDDDTVYGQGGDDTIEGGDGIDQLFGGVGNDDIFTGPGATVGTTRFASGGSGDDTITGGPDADRIFGVGGNDIINGMAGMDDLRGGANNDTINGGADSDFILGQAGLDTLFGDGGNDTIRGGLANDNVSGGVDDDFLYGEGGRDSLFGESGQDSLFGGADNDTLDGGTGIDDCDGEGGTDTATDCETVIGVP